MKPRSKAEHAMLALAAKLPPISEKQRQYAFTHAFAPRAVIKPRKREVRCLCCSQTVVYDKLYIDSFLRNGQYDCPYCGRTMDAEKNSPGTPWREWRYFTVITTFRGHQVVRTWEIARLNYTAKHYTHYDINEIFQIWISDEGKEVITGRQLHRSFNSTVWDFNAPLGIRHHNGGGTGYYQFDDIYDISGNLLYPDIRVTPLLRRNGWTSRLLRYQGIIAMTDAMRYLLSVPASEMLVKTGQLDLFLDMVRRGRRELPFLHSVRIANRNGYIVQDAQMWHDMLRLAEGFGMDTHNPKIVCPPDLVKAHDALLARAARARQKRERQERMAEARKWEERYQQDKAPYFGICFGNDNISIAVIRSVAEIAEEGEAMHHCVFDAEYYRKSDSLILSARDRNGTRLETIEVNLRTFKVVQSRTKFNKTSDFHAEILSLMQQNMHLIRRAKPTA